MISLQGFSRKAIVAAAFAAASLVVLPAQSAYADQFQYVFSGMADGTVNGTLYTNALFSLTFNEDTSAINDHGNGIYSYDNVQAFLSAGQTFMLNDVTLVVNGNAGQQSVGFYDASGLNGLGLSMVTPVGYNLDADLNIPVSNSNLTSAFLGGTFTDTHGATLQFTNVESLGFSAVDAAPTPEPSSLLLLTSSGLPALALLRRRFSKP